MLHVVNQLNNFYCSASGAVKTQSPCLNNRESGKLFNNITGMTHNLNLSNFL